MNTIKTRRINHYAIADKLKAKPGRWVKVGTYVNRKAAIVMAGEVRLGVRPAYKGLALQVKTRSDNEVWARTV